MPDGSMMEWPVPVITRIDTQKRDLTVGVLDGEVVMQQPGAGAPVIIPPSSDDALCDAVRRARAVASQMGRGL